MSDIILSIQDKMHDDFAFHNITVVQCHFLFFFSRFETIKTLKD